jgi:hypothetical protein
VITYPKLNTYSTSLRGEQYQEEEEEEEEEESSSEDVASEDEVSH